MKRTAGKPIANHPAYKAWLVLAFSVIICLVSVVLELNIPDTSSKVLTASSAPASGETPR